jgi:hypothetical protein
MVKSTLIMKPKLLLCLQEPGTAPCPQPDVPSPHSTYYFNMNSNTTFHLLQGLPSFLLLSGFPTKTLYTTVTKFQRSLRPPQFSWFDNCMLVVYKPSRYIGSVHVNTLRPGGKYMYHLLRSSILLRFATKCVYRFYHSHNKQRLLPQH